MVERAGGISSDIFLEEAIGFEMFLGKEARILKGTYGCGLNLGKDWLEFSWTRVLE